MNRDVTLQDLTHKNEKLYFVFAVIISIISYVALILSVVGIIVIAISIILPLFISALINAHIRYNGVRLSPKQFPRVFDKIKELCEKMELASIPDVYVIESGGALNAFATRFFGRNMIVLYSDIFDLINSGGEEELTFVIAHELAHIKRKHITKQLLIVPAMWIPFFGEAYSRTCEYTCDRMAGYFTGNSEAAMNGLTILAVGKALYRQVDRSEYLYQCSQEKGFFIWLAEKVSTHPPLPKRINEIEIFMEKTSVVLFNKSSKTVWVLSMLGVLFFTVVMVGFLFTSENIKGTWDKLLATIPSEQGTELIKATAEGDLQAIKQQLKAICKQSSNNWKRV